MFYLPVLLVYLSLPTPREGIEPARGMVANLDMTAALDTGPPAQTSGMGNGA